MSLGDEKLVRAINVVARGSYFLPEKAETSVARQLRAQPDNQDALNDAERMLLQLLHEELTVDEMAMRMNLASVTVKMRLARLYRRFHVRTRTHLLAKAARKGLV